MRLKILGLTLWQWLVLSGLLLANVGLVVAFAPVIRAELQTGWDAAVSPRPAASVALAESIATSTPHAPRVPAPTTPPTPTPAATFVLNADPPILEAPPAVLPDEVRLTGIGGQPQTLPLSCEARAAANWAAFFGVSIDELEFLNRLPTSDNPDFGFVGDVRGVWGQVPPQPYGVHADPVAVLLRQYGVNAYAHRDLRWDDLRAQVAAGKPVIVWVVGHVERGTPATYTAANGLTTTVARYEHTVLLTGYTSERVTILDGEKVYSRPVERFLESWAVLGNMAIVRGLLAAR